MYLSVIYIYHLAIIYQTSMYHLSIIFPYNLSIIYLLHISIHHLLPISVTYIPTYLSLIYIPIFNCLCVWYLCVGVLVWGQVCVPVQRPERMFNTVLYNSFFPEMESLTEGSSEKIAGQKAAVTLLSRPAPSSELELQMCTGEPGYEFRSSCLYSKHPYLLS